MTDSAPSWTDEHARDYAQKYGDWPTNAAVAELARLRSADRVLDVGMGTGSALRHAIALRPIVAIGIDPTPAMVTIARQQADAEGLTGRVVFHQAAASAIPFPDGLFNVAWAINSLPHWEDARAGCAELFRVLAPRGRVIIADEDVMGTGTHPKMDNVQKLLLQAGFVDPKRTEHTLDAPQGPILLTLLQATRP